MQQNITQESFPPILNIDDLARLIHRKPSTIMVDRFRRPESLPPDCTPPYQKAPVWKLSAVLEWYSTFQKPAAEPRQEEPPIENSEKKVQGRPTIASKVEKRKQEALVKTTLQSSY